MAFLKKTKKTEAEGKKEAKEKIETKEKKINKTEKKTEKEKVLIKPHVTEKASFLGEKGAYVFKVASSFNKIMVKEAIKKQYGVNPLKVSMVNMPGKSFFIKSRKAQKPGFKKAVVYLKKGEKITF